MRLQSAIEFLTTYGFMFIIIGIVISVLAFVTVSPVIYPTAQCSGFAGPYCQFVQFYSNSTNHFGLLTLVLTNSESVPLNISNITVQIRSISAVGTCTPLVVMPGQSTVCVTKLSMAPSLGTYTQGFYQLYAKACNAGVNNLTSSCAYQSANYSGSFTAPATPSLAIPVTMLALQGSKTVQLAPYPAVPILPNYEVTGSGFLSLNLSKKVLEYAFGTPGYIGGIYVGLRVVPFPSPVNSLNNADVDCSTPGRYNSTYSVFATTLYIPSSSTLNITIVTDDAMEVYYKPASVSSWSSAFHGAAWHGEGATQYTNNGVIVGGGLYNLEILWSNLCAPGVQVLKISNFSSSV